MRHVNGRDVSTTRACRYLRDFFSRAGTSTGVFLNNETRVQAETMKFSFLF